MTRKISTGDVQTALTEAYEAYKGIKEGAIDPRNTSAKAGDFGVSVVLRDGTALSAGNSEAVSPLGAIAKVAVDTVLFSQNTPDELYTKMASLGCACKAAKKADVKVCVKALRAISAVVPQNDRDGKMGIIENTLEGLVGSAPVFNDKLYETLTKAATDNDTVNKLADAGVELFDSTPDALDIANRLAALSVDTDQAAALGATIAADGFNPSNRRDVFDGNIAADIVASMSRGCCCKDLFNTITVGLPVVKSFGGLVLAVMPGFGAIAAYSPELDESGLSVKAAKAVKYIARTLQLNVFASARVEAVK